jgi:hypothetical protein
MYSDTWSLYLARLEREFGNPNKVFKVGITKFLDPMNRLTYQGSDEPFPIVRYFPQIELIKVVSNFRSKDHAEYAERRIMGMIKQRFKSPKFHDWDEKDPISGITEMRIWRENEVDYALAIV